MKIQLILALASSLFFCDICHAADVTVKFNGKKATVKQEVKDSVSVSVEGTHVNIVSTYQAHKLTVRLTGKSDDGQLILKTDGKAKVKLDHLNLTSQEGAPLWLKNKKKVELVAVDGTENILCIAACNDTANHKAAVIWAKDKVRLSGKGVLNVLAKGDGCKGIRSKDDITIEDLTLNVETTGNNLGEKANPFGGGGGMPPFSFDNISEEDKARFEEMRKNFEEMMQNGGGFPMMGGFGNPLERNDSTRQGGFGGFPMMGGFGNPLERNDSTRQGGFGGFPMGGFGAPPMGDGEEGGMPFGKHKYNGTTKGIKSQKKVIVNSGTVTVTTSSPGAEGIEGKEGVLLNGGKVNVMAVDDAINANARIEFNGADVIARSTNNDAVDANLMDFFAGGFGGFFGGGGQNQNNDPAIIITGGTVYAWSQVGAPEEGLDCDFSPIEISGGRVFSVGAGMGEMPSVPTNELAKQATALLIGIDIVQDEPVFVYDSTEKLIDTITVPFSLKRSSSIISSPQFKTGNTYTVKTKGYERTFTLNENFTIVR